LTGTGRGRTALPALLVLAAGCAESPSPGHPLPRLSGEITELESPARPGSGQPNLALASDRSALLSWVEPTGEEEDGHTLFFARLRESGWEAPTRIASGSDWFVNWADFPSLAALADGTLFAHWLRRSGPGTYAYDVTLALSRDGGRTWSEPLTPHRDGTRSEHGFVAMAPLSESRMGVVWLDGRKTVDERGELRPHEAPEVEMALRFAAVDSEGRVSEERELDPRVCDCCQTGAAPLPEGLLAVYRDRSGEELRDIAAVRMVAGRWSAPEPVASDGWRISGCPVNGPAVAAAGPRLAVAWFGAPDEKAHARVAFSTDAGAGWGPGLRVDDGRPLGRVGVALMPGGDALVSWMEQVESGAELRVRRVSSGGGLSTSRTVAGTDATRSSGFPRMVVTRDRALFAWRDAGSPPRVRTASLALDAP
jgi:hypothetical protein